MFNRKAYESEYRARNRDEINQKHQEWYAMNRDRELNRRRELKLARTEDECQRVRIIHAEHNKRWRHKHPEQAKAIRNRVSIKLKLEVITAYGGGKAACVKCDFEDVRALSLDHVNGGGSIHRRENGGRFSGNKLYVYLRQHDYPLGYQTLCMNCQWIKRHENREYGIERRHRNEGKHGNESSISATFQQKDC